jgi:ribosome biogenesis GTPase
MVSGRPAAPSGAAGLEGVVLERDGAAYRVQTADGELRAVLRGKLKQDRRAEGKVVVGDRVVLEPGEGGELHGITAVAPRTTLLERRTPEGRGTRPVAANVDQVLVVSATRDPDPVPQLVDRLLALAEVNEIPAAVVLNKIDLAAGDAMAERLTRAGYEVFRTCAVSGTGIDALRERMRGRTSVVTGPSGAGKSSLLNAVQPGLRLRTGEISRKVRRGKQTTVSAVMAPLAAGGFIVDTPGFSEVGLWGVVPQELASCFPEMRPHLGECRFQDCSHLREPGCAVRAALERGEIDPSRYQSYRMLLEELESAPEDWE